MRIALINSGLGLLAAAAELHRLRPDADLVLAMAGEGGEGAGARGAVADAAARPLAGCGAVVLGCTEYELAAGEIAAALPGTTLFGSAAAVAAQALRRAGADGSGTRPPGTPRAAGTVQVLLSGRRAHLPAAALLYPEGRLLADLVADRRPAGAGEPAARARWVPA